MKPGLIAAALGGVAPVVRRSPLRPTVDRRIFRVGEEAWRYQGVTAFMLGELWRQGEHPAVIAFVRKYRSIRYNVFRVLANKPEVPGLYPGWDTPPLPVALDLSHALAEEGAYIEWTLVGSQVDATFVPSWIQAFRDQCPNVFIEGVNEPGHAAQYPTTDPIDALVRPVKGDLPYATGDYRWDPSLARGTYGTIHTDRDDPCNTARKAKAVLEMYDSIATIPWVGDEPAKPQDLDYRIDCTLALFAIYGLFGAGGTFHTLSGQFGQLPDDREWACAQAAIAGLTAFPPDAPNQGGYVHDTADEAVSGSLRTYRSGPYGVRVCPTVPGYSILIGV